MPGPFPGAVHESVFSDWAQAEPDCLLFVRTAELRVVWVNWAAAATFGCEVGDLLGTAFLDLVAGPEQGTRTPPAARLVDPRRALDREVRVVRRDGQTRQVLLHSSPAEDGWMLRLSPDGEGDDATAELRLAHDRFQALAGLAPVGIFASETGVRLGYANDAFGKTFGVEPAQLLGTRWLGSFHGQDQGSVLAALTEVLKGATSELSARLLRVDGEERSVELRIVPVRGGVRAAGFVGTLEDVTERRDLERTLAHQAGHDLLTGLSNRRTLLQALAADVAGVRAGGSALFFIDLDEFKRVNDLLGHGIGDALLVEVSSRLLREVRDGDLVARFGGDEFAVLCHGLSGEPRASEVAGRLLEAVNAPLVLEGHPVTVSASIGVVLLGEGHREAEDVVRDADAAMYQAKAAGKDRWVLFDARAREQHRRRHELIADLGTAITGQQLHVAYQPVVRLGPVVTGAPYAVEALARWHHPTLGDISPQEFIALAEESGLIAALSRQVLREACRQTQDWQQRYGEQAPSRVCVNISPLQLRQDAFVHEIASVLRETGLPGTSLCLELTESAVMEDPSVAAASFAALRELGVTVAIDDFGTGYSSLALLRTLPVDLLKVDRSFLSELDQEGTARVVAAVVGLGQVLGLSVVAEGVESQRQVDELVRLGCPMAQGFLFSRPLTAEQLETRVAQGWPW